MFIELKNETGVLKKRNEFKRRYHAELRVIPSHQRFSTREHRLFRADIVLRLQVYKEPAAFERRPEILKQALAVELRLVHLAVIDPHSAAEACPYGIRRQPCIFEAALDIKGFIDIGINAHAKTHSVSRGILPDKSLRRLLQKLFIVFTVRTVDKEHISAAVAGHPAGLTRDHADTLSHAGKHIISVLPAVTFVYHMEAVDIDHDGIHWNVPEMAVKHPHIVEKVARIIEPCQRVSLCGFDYRPLFGKLYAASDSRLHDLAVRVRLWYEIHGAYPEALDLGALVCSQYYDRDI